MRGDLLIILAFIGLLIFGCIFSYKKLKTVKGRSARALLKFGYVFCCWILGALIGIPVYLLLLFTGTPNGPHLVQECVQICSLFGFAIGLYTVIKLKAPGS